MNSQSKALELLHAITGGNSRLTRRLARQDLSMTDDDRIVAAQRRIAMLSEKLDVAPPTCSECRWCFGADPGMYKMGEGQNCSNPVVMVTGDYCEVSGEKGRVMNIYKARNAQGPCGPNAVFFQASVTARNLMQILREFIFGETK